MFFPTDLSADHGSDSGLFSCGPKAKPSVGESSSDSDASQEPGTKKARGKALKYEIKRVFSASFSLRYEVLHAFQEEDAFNRWWDVEGNLWTCQSTQLISPKTSRLLGSKQKQLSSLQGPREVGGRRGESWSPRGGTVGPRPQMPPVHERLLTLKLGHMRAFAASYARSAVPLSYVHSYSLRMLILLHATSIGAVLTTLPQVLRLRSCPSPCQPVARPQWAVWSRHAAYPPLPNRCRSCP